MITMLDSARIAQRFIKAQEYYDQTAVVQQNMAHQLVWWMFAHGVKPQNRMLEIGCGTGFMTHLLPLQEQHWLNDLYQFPDLEKWPVQWLVGDIEQLELPTRLSVIVSNATWQWLKDIPKLLQRCAAALQKDGWLCLTTFGPDNLHQLKSLTHCGLEYLSVTQWRHALLAAGFDVVLLREETQTLIFENGMAVLAHLKYTGVTATTKQFQWSKGKLLQFSQDYQILAQQQNQLYGCPLSYQPIYILAKKHYEK